MTDCFYINGSIQPEGNRTLSKPIMRTVNGKSHVFAVSDSLSVKEGATTPSHLLCDTLKKYNDKLQDANIEQLDILMRDVTTDLNGEISAVSSASSYTDYAASFSLLTVNGGVATVTTLGNTSAFMIRDGEIKDLSTPLAAYSAAHMPSNLVGNRPSGDIITPHMSDSYEITKDDVFLLCSDGLTKSLSTERISYIMSLDLSDERLATRLVSEAIAGGGNDDITVMIVRNGGQPYASGKKTKKVALMVIPVIILAVLLALLSAGIRSCSKKPEISHEGSNISEEQIPTATEFMSPQSPAATPDDFILRE